MLMTVNYFMSRLTRIMAHNAAFFDVERNRLSVVVRLRRKTPTGKIRDTFIPVTSLHGGRLTVKNTDFGLEILVEESNAL